MYNIIYADPPWLYADARTHASAGMARSAYECMSLDDICKVPVYNMHDTQCALAMWATWPKLQDALYVMKAWGFKYITALFVWVKVIPSHKYNFFVPSDIYSGLGHYTKANTEFVLYGRRGPPLPRRALDVKQVVIAPRGRHSAKPPEVRDRLVRLFGDVPRIELFARERTPGWDVWGNEIDSN